MTKTTEVEKTAVSLRVDPRVRMKEIRAEVAMYLKDGSNPGGLNHMGELPENMEDARRVIVAIQDLYEIEKEKHRKATTHICELVHILDGMSEVQNELMSMVHHRDMKIGRLRNQLEGAEKHNFHMRDNMNQAHTERDAVLTTMKLLNGQQPRQEMSVGVDMGSSNAEPARSRGPSSLHDLLLQGFKPMGTVTGRLR